MTITTPVAKKPKVLEAAREQHQPYSTLTCANPSRSAIVRAQTRKKNMRWRKFLRRASTGEESYNTVRSGLDMATILCGTMRPISGIARTDSMTFMRPIPPTQGLQKDCGSGHRVGRRRRPTLITSRSRSSDNTIYCHNLL